MGHKLNSKQVCMRVSLHIARNTVAVAPLVNIGIRYCTYIRAVKRKIIAIIVSEQSFIWKTLYFVPICKHG